MKSVFIFLLSWGAPFLALWCGAHWLFYPPGDWIGAAIVSFCFALGIGALRKWRLEQRDAAIIARASGPLQDGQRVAVAGTLEPTRAILQAPLSGQDSVVYDYSISHIPEQSPLLGKTSNSSSRPAPREDRTGLAMVPCVIRHGLQEVRLLAFPTLQRFATSDLQDGTRVRARARHYLSTTPFKDQSIFNAMGQIAMVLEDRSGCLQADWMMTDNVDLEKSIFTERVVPPGVPVCVLGTYSAKDNAIVPLADTGGVTLIRGSREEALEFMRDKGLGSLIAAVLFLLVPGPAAYGILSHREHYFEENHQPTARSERLDAAGVN